MKKSIYVSVLLLLSLICFAQSVTEREAKELFGERFISTKEAGFTEKVSIPFSRENLQHDRVSWLIPINTDGVPKYKLVQARYVPNEQKKTDTLCIKDAEEVLRIMNKACRNFPTNEPLRFFKTKTHGDSREGVDFLKTIVCDFSNCKIIDIPQNAIIALANKNNISYVLEYKNGSISVDIGSDDNIDAIKGYTIMTIVYVVD
ncbi:MAG: hypothetical protein NTU81_02435 [Candidatus Nomurabacteria bacterium]|nr:hypothetical protein [Candidatus Nomurabacteria bacterium]